MTPTPRPALTQRPSLALALVLLSTACVSVRATPLAGDILPPVPADSVRIFATNPPEKYVEIAMMRVDGIIVSDGKSARALREKAGKLGANGVILLNARAAVLGGGRDIGVVITGQKPSAVVIEDDDDVNEFERAVAIRYEPQSSDSTRTTASRP